MSDYRLIHGDCLTVLPGLDAGSVDLIATDLPYGTTACAWDEIIPFVPMWEQVKRVLKPRGTFITTASQPFTSKLVMSNLAWFKYEWIWVKNKPSNFLNARIMPLKTQENIIVFCSKMPLYKPVGLMRNHKINKRSGLTDNYGVHGLSNYSEFDNYPKDVLYFQVENSGHPTQKPVALYEYLIRTYSNPGDVVLDFCAGSGTTGVAAIQTGRRFIGVEKDATYFKIAQKRLAGAQPPLFTEAAPLRKETHQHEMF